MPKETPSSNSRLIPTPPLPAEADRFAERVHGLLDGQPKDEATVARALEGMDGMFDVIAARLYSMASMLVGEGEDSIRLVETAVATADISSCTDAEEARRSSRLALATAAIELIAGRDPALLASPDGLEHAVTCIEDDDLDAAAEAREAMERMIAGPDRDRVRHWLESLPTAMRTIYVLRAVAGFSATETAELLAAHGGSEAAGWTADAVRELFRQALCSLASQLIHATAGR
jgi:DNA-directed RNA polymerase specialized sigma24 family protein